MTAETPLDEEEFRRWREEADRALLSSRLQAEAGLHNWACFSAEQAAQFAVKGLLHSLGRGPWGHDLVELGGMLEEVGIAVSEKIADRLRRLSRHYIAARYPDAHPAGSAAAHYGPLDAEQAVGDATQILGFTDDAWEELRA